MYLNIINLPLVNIPKNHLFSYLGYFKPYLSILLSTRSEENQQRTLPKQQGEIFKTAFHSHRTSP